MKKPKLTGLFFPLITILAVSLACGLPGLEEEAGGDLDITATLEALETLVAGEAGVSPDDATEGETEPEAPPTIEVPPETPTVTPTPSPSPTVTPTEIPCDRAAFVSDVTVPDGADFSPGEVFTKTWRLKNTGSCQWTSGYDLVHVSGDQMGAPASVQLTAGIVSPGQNVDVSVQLTAPMDEGGYKGFFKIRNSGNALFGVGDLGTVAFWVEIEVIEPVDPPDLVVVDIILDPNPPTKGEAVTVTVVFKNQGGATSEDFAVRWWPGEGYVNPGATWTIIGGLSEGEQESRTSVYAGYPSHYPSINTKAVVDISDTVDESNEGNNVRLENITVLSP